MSCRPAKVMAAIFVDQNRIATAGSDNRILVWDVKKRKTTLSLGGHNGSVAALAVDREAKVLASGSYDTTATDFSARRNEGGEDDAERGWADPLVAEDRIRRLKLDVSRFKQG